MTPLQRVYSLVPFIFPFFFLAQKPVGFDSADYGKTEGRGRKFDTAVTSATANRVPDDDPDVETESVRCPFVILLCVAT